MSKTLHWVTQDDITMATAPNGELFMIVPAGGGFSELLLGSKKATDGVFDDASDAMSCAENLASQMPAAQSIDQKVNAFFDALAI